MVITGLHNTICEAKTFGTIVVPDIIETEVRHWLSQNSSKRAKFGKLVDDIYDLALRLNKIEIPKIDPQKLSSKKSQIKMVFRALQSSGKSKLGAPPSDADSSILAITILTNSRICTQEKTLRALTNELIEHSPLGFVDLLEALVVNKCSSKQDILDALENLQIYGEHLSEVDFARLEKIK